ncbi:MAG: hypothetical protein KatS3mg087_1508 [Patescibacteria group bacterium]|nr:MAG: hypothetical protein KatS3mg087_1508 [Patescibacteria group bacterium]
MKEVLIALQTPSPKGHRGVPVLLWGAPGVGKSSFIESLARDDFPVLTLIGSLHDPTDFNGLPVLEGGEVRFAPPRLGAGVRRTRAGGVVLRRVDDRTPRSTGRDVAACTRKDSRAV